MWGQGVVFPVLNSHLIIRHRFVKLFPKGERHPFLLTNLLTNKLSYLIYYLTQLFHLM